MRSSREPVVAIAIAVAAVAVAQRQAASSELLTTTSRQERIEEGESEIERARKKGRATVFRHSLAAVRLCCSLPSHRTFPLRW